MSDARRRADNRMIERNFAHERLHRPPDEAILAMRAARAIENNPALMHSRRRGEERRDSIVRMEQEEERGWLDRRVAEVTAAAAVAAEERAAERELARPEYIASLDGRVRAGSPLSSVLSQFDLLGRYGEGHVIRPAAAVIARTLRSGPRQSGEGPFINWARSIPRAVPPAEQPDTGSTAAYYDSGGVAPAAAAAAPSGVGADGVGADGVGAVRNDGSSSSSDEEEEDGAGRRRSKMRRRKRYSRKRRRTRRVSAKNNHKSKIKSRKKRRRKSPRGRKSSRKYR